MQESLSHPEIEVVTVSSARSDINATADMKTATMNPIAMDVGGYHVLIIKDIKVAWIRTTNLDGTKSCYSTLSMDMSTDRMYVYAGGELHVETRGIDGGLINDWNISSIATSCGLRNEIKNFRTGFNPDFFDLIVTANTRIVIGASTWKYC